MKIFMASFGTETNVFAPMPTGWEDFEECYFYRHDTLSQPSKLFNSPMHLWNKRAQEDGHEVICSLSTFAHACRYYGSTCLRGTKRHGSR